jgi:amino acid transporter
MRLMTNQQSIFTRNATGLVKSISPTTMLLANMGEIGFGTGILSLNFYNGFYAGGNLVYTTLIMTLVCLCLAFIYFHIIKSVGRAGGDYVWMSRNIGPIAGGALTLGFVFTGWPFIAISLNWLWTLSLGPSFSAIGAVAPNTGASVISFISSLALNTTSNAHIDLISISLIILAIVMAINIVSPKSGYLMLAGFTVIAIVGSLMMLGVYVGMGSTGIHNAVSNFLNANGANATTNYNGVSTIGAASPFSWMPTFLLLPVVAYTLPWVNNAAAFSGELRNLKRTAWMSTLVPVAVSGVLIAVFLQLYYSTLGFNFATGASVLPTGLAGTFVYANMLTIATIAMGGNVAFIWIMNIAFAFWYLASLQQTILAISRYAFGMSFDKLIPVQFSRVHDRFHSPYIGLIISFVIAIPMIVIASYKNWLSLFSTGAMGQVFFAFIGITAIIYAIKKRNSLKSLTGALVVTGAVSAAFFLYTTYLFLTDTVYLVNDISWYIMIPLWVLGAMLYPISSAYYKGKNMDLSLVFKELPPE